MKNNTQSAKLPQTQVDFSVTGPRILLETINYSHDKKVDKRMFETDIVLRINSKETVIRSFEKKGYRSIVFSAYNSALAQLKKLPLHLRQKATINGDLLRKAEKIVQVHNRYNFV